MIGFKTQSDSFTIQPKVEKAMNSSFMTVTNGDESMIPESKRIKKVTKVINHLGKYEIFHSLKILEGITMRHK